MSSILVATDFSLSAMYACQYAVGLANALGITKIIVYHSYESVPDITDVPGVPKTEKKTVVEESAFFLDMVKREMGLLDENSNIQIETVANEIRLEVGVEQMIENWSAEVVVVGTTGKSGLEKFLMGSNTRHLALTCSVPLLIIPKGVEYKKLKKIVFACDYKKVDRNTPVIYIKRLLDIFKAKLLVLNVVPEGKRSDNDILLEKNRVKTFLTDLSPSYHHVEGLDVSEAIADFAELEQVDLVITIPNTYGFFENMFHRSVSKKLSEKTEVPLLIWKDT